MGNITRSIAITYEQSQWLEKSKTNVSELFRTLLDDHISRVDSNEGQLDGLEKRRQALMVEIERIESEMDMIREAIWEREMKVVREAAKSVVEMNTGLPLTRHEIVAEVKARTRLKVVTDAEIEELLINV